MTQDKAHAMMNVILFIHNYPGDWVDQVWHDDPHLKDHIKQKWYGYAEKNDSRIAILQTIADLSTNNQVKLMEWIDKQKFNFGGIINDLTEKKTIKQMFE